MEKKCIQFQGWIYGLKRFKRDLKLMLGKSPNFYWIICFKILTPIFTITAVLIAIYDNAEVVLNQYRYPQWAHNIGWAIVAVILIPLPICFLFSLSKHGFGQILEPDDDWKPAIESNKINENTSPIVNYGYEDEFHIQKFNETKF